MSNAKKKQSLKRKVKFLYKKSYITHSWHWNNKFYAKCVSAGGISDTRIKIYNSKCTNKSN